MRSLLPTHGIEIVQSLVASLLLLVRHLLLLAMHLFLVASLLPVAMPGAPSRFLFLVRPGALQALAALAISS